MMKDNLVYDKLIDSILEKNILPYATLYHWDLPKVFDDNGGWQNRDTCDWFADYTNLLMKKFLIYLLTTLLDL